MNLRRVATAAIALLAAWVVFATHPAHAQGTSGPIAPKPGTTMQRAPQGPIRLRVALVNTPVAVSDAKGELILDLQQKNFHVFDDGVEQTIDAFDPGGEPLSVVLL